MMNRSVRRVAMMTGTLVLFVGMCGCDATPAVGGGGDDGGDGNDNTNTPSCTDLTYANFAAGFMNTYCISCYSSELTGADRQGSPEGIDFDTLDAVVAQLERIRVRAVEDGTMPPATADAIPTTGELDQLAEWIDCDAPA